MAIPRIVHRATPNSSAISRIGYNVLTGDLMILFNKPAGRYPEYRWGGVPRDLAEDFMTSTSPGQFYHRHIRRGGYRISPSFGSYSLGGIGRGIRRLFRRR